MSNTTVISISSASWKDNKCTDIIDTMLKLRIMASVTDNLSVLCGKERCWLEKGCVLTFGSVTKKELESQVFPSLIQKHGIRCAHLHIHGGYRGCIKNYVEKSKCPEPVEYDNLNDNL